MACSTARPRGVRAARFQSNLTEGSPHFFVQSETRIEPAEQATCRIFKHSINQPSSAKAFRPASVIRIRTTSILRPPDLLISGCAMAKPTSIRWPSISAAKPWASISGSATLRRPPIVRTLSARRCVRLSAILHLITDRYAPERLRRCSTTDRTRAQQHRSLSAQGRRRGQERCSTIVSAN
jgi:hypothetical protein